MGAGILLLCSHFFLCQAQKFLRIEATYSVKEQLSDGTLSLQVGKVFFNRSNGIIFYKISHPEKNIVLATDTFMLTIDASGKKTGISGTGFVSLSVYNILLRGDLAYYGLDKMPYKMEEVHTEDTLVISTWIIRDDMEASISKIMLAQHDKQLYSLVGMDKQDHIVLKQFFEDYSVIGGLAVPTQIISFFYNEGSESINWLYLKDIRINNFDNEADYSHTLSDFMR